MSGNESTGEQPVTLELTRNEALVLDQWLAEMEDPDDPEDLPPFERAALRVRWDLECLLEAELHEHFAPDADE